MRVAKRANQRDHIEAELPMRQGPVPFLFRTVGSMIPSTGRILTSTNCERELAQTIEGGHRANSRGCYPQPLSTLPALLVQGNEETLLICSRTRMFSCHRLFAKGNYNVQATLLIGSSCHTSGCTCSLSEKSLLASHSERHERQTTDSIIEARRVPISSGDSRHLCTMVEHRGA